MIFYMIVLLGWFVFCVRFWEVEMDNDRREWVNLEGGEVVGRLREGKKRDVFVENEVKLEVGGFSGSGEKCWEVEGLNVDLF